MIPPQKSAESYEVVPGVRVVAPGLLNLVQSRVLVAADVHLAYEDVIGGALPTWSTTEMTAAILLAARVAAVREIVLLGDIIHGSIMSDGAAKAVAESLGALRAQCALTLVAGNHEGRGRGAAVLGDTVEAATRDGWLLVHGDKPPAPGVRAIIGHLHPSLRVSGAPPVPAFLAGERVIVVPALTPYSEGLDVCSDACMHALRSFDVTRADLQVVAVGAGRVFPFGTLSQLKKTIARPGSSGPRDRFRRRFLRPG